MDTVGNTSVDRLEFEEASIDNRLPRVILSAWLDNGFKKPKRIQNPAMVALVDCPNVIIRAKKESGKTLAYVMSLLYPCSTFMIFKGSTPSVLVILPTPELCLEVVEQLATVINSCFPDKYKIGQLEDTSLSEMALLEGIPDIAVSTPSWLLQNGFLQDKARQKSLEVVVLDEVDQIMLGDNDYENVLKPLMANLHEYCRRVVVSGDPSSDLQKLKALHPHTPYIVTLTDTGILEAGVVPYNVHQYYVSCKKEDKLLYLFSLWVFSCISPTTLIFTNSIRTSNELKSFLEKFGLKSALVYDGMPLPSRGEIIEGLKSRGLDFIIIAVDKSDDDKPVSSLLGEIDLNDIGPVVNFDMPRSVSGYFRRIDHTGKKTGECASLVASSKDKKLWRAIQSHMGEDSKFITPVEMLENVVEEDARPIVKKAVLGENCVADLKRLWASLY